MSRRAAVLGSLLLLSSAAAGGLTPDKPLAAFALARWTTEEGLPSDSLLNVVQTADGYLWIASFLGLARFDGLAFEVFDKKDLPRPAPNGFYELLEDGGKLWIGTQGGGVWLRENGRFRPLDPGFRATVRSLLVDRAGTLWVGTADLGLFRAEGGALTAFEHPAVAAVTVRALAEDDAGALWVGTEGKGLTRFAGARVADGAAATWNAASGLASDNVTSLAEDGQGGMWIGTQAGLDRFAGGTIAPVPELAGVEVYRIYRDAHRCVWLATQQGLFRRTAAADRFEQLASYRGRPLIGVTALAFDHEGGVWLTSYSDGLLQLKDGKFRSLTVADGLATAKVDCVTETRDGRLLAGADDGTVNVIAGGEVARLELRTPLPDLRVRHLYEDSSGVLWISTYSGLLRVDGAGEKLLTTADGLPSDQVRWVREDRRGDLWIGTRNGGLARARPGGGFDVLDRTAGLTSDFIFSLGEDLAGRLVVGTHEGVNLIDADGRVRAFTTADGLPGDLVFNTFTDAEGAVWLATNGGLARLRDGEIRAATARDGLPADSVFDYREDGLGHAWLSSALGVVRLDKAGLVGFLDGRRPDFEARLFDDRDGMPDRECTGATAFLQARDGTLWFPTLGGLAVVDPRAVALNPVPPPVVLRRFAAGDEEIDLGGGPIEIPPGRKRFAFEFAALSFQAPEKVAVRYRLEGFDDEWIAAGSERGALYTGLPHGAYTFRVQAANNDGVWNLEGAALRFRVRPFFYQTPLFFGLVAVVAAAGLWSVYRRRVARVERRNARLQAIIADQQRAEREKERLIGELAARNKELEFFNYTLSHDLKSPLFTIHGFLGMLERDAAAGDEGRLGEDLRHIRGAVAQMGKLLNDLPQLSRRGGPGPAREPLAVGELARLAVERAAARIAESGVAVEIAPDLPAAAGDRGRILEVLEILVDNALKFTDVRRRPRVDIGWRRDGAETVYFVRDNGRGVEPRYRDKIFEPFEKLVHGSAGTGLGLAIARRVVEEHGGRIWAESDGPGHGAAFCFTLPAARVLTPAP